MSALWGWLLLASGAAWATKLAGLTVPRSWFAHPGTRRVATLVPVAMLSALAVSAVLDGGVPWQVDPALAVGTGAGIATVAARRGVLAAFLTGAVTTALVRLALG